MIDIKKNFDISFNFLKKNKYLALPYLFSYIFLFILIMFCLYQTGLYSVFQDYTQVKSGYTPYLIDTIGNGEIPMSEEDYISANLSDWDFKNIFNLQIFITIGIFILIWYLSSTYFDSVALYQISNVLKGRHNIGIEPYFDAISFYIKYLFYKFTYLFIIFSPIIIISFIGFLILNNNPSALLSVPIIWVLGYILLLFFMFFWITYISIRFFFSESALFFDDLGIIKSYKKSLNISKNRFKYVKIYLFGPMV
jgi:hypothetical protein